jgi:hypothetical protein
MHNISICQSGVTDGDTHPEVRFFAPGLTVPGSLSFSDGIAESLLDQYGM